MFLKNPLESIASCDLQLWLNYRGSNNYNRVVIKKCEKSGKNNGKSSYSCQGCKRTMLTTNGLNQVSWPLVANFESKMLNYKAETYRIDLKTNRNETFGANKKPQLRPFWLNIPFPVIKFTFVPRQRSLSGSATCFNDPHCISLDHK